MSSFWDNRKERSIINDEMSLKVDRREYRLIILIFFKKKKKGEWRREFKESDEDSVALVENGRGSNQGCEKGLLNSVGFSRGWSPFVCSGARCMWCFAMSSATSGKPARSSRENEQMSWSRARNWLSSFDDSYLGVRIQRYSWPQ